MNIAERVKMKEKPIRLLRDDGRCVRCTGEDEHAWGKRYHPFFVGQWEKEFPFLHCGECGMQMEYP